MKSFARLIIFSLSCLFLWSCATPGSPIGGPKDEAPPVIIRSTPPNYSTNLTPQVIKYYFDEIIDIKDINKNLILSPPMNKPEIKASGKTLSIKIMDSLRPQTTYTISFGRALADYNEANVLEDFKVVFSTGNTIDSLSITGQVLDAYTLQPVKDITAVLLNTFADLVFKDQRPLFTSRTTNEGRFKIDHLPNQCMFLAVIKDANNDFSYDSLQDEIGFLTTCVAPRFVAAPVFPDSCSAEDSLDILNAIKATDSTYQLLLFKQDLPQSITNSEFISTSSIKVNFRNPATKPSFRILNPSIDISNVKMHWQSGKEILFFLPEWGIKNLTLLVRDGNFSDTLKLLNTHAEKPIDPLRLSVSTKQLDYFDTLKINFNTPVEHFIRQKFTINYKDSLTSEVSYKITNDTRNQIYFYDTLFTSGESYHIVIPDSSFMDIYGQINKDTVDVKFSISKPESYAALTFFIQNKPEKKYYLDILKENFDVIATYDISGLDTVSLPHMKAGKYKFRIFIDENNNGYWDAGNFRELRFPEKVFILPKTLSLEANWEYEEDWKLLDSTAETVSENEEE